jgi:long-chain acyl-CoA synthetase
LRVARLACALRGRLGLLPGDRVAIVMPNAPAYVEILYACWWAGLAAVPVNAKLHAREIAYVLGHSGARLAFVTGATADLVADAARFADETPPRVIDADGSAFADLFAGDVAPMTDTQANDLAWLFYTSGTTGRPKGAMLSHRNLLAMTLRYYADVDQLSTDDTMIHAAPLSHGGGLYSLPQIARGGHQVVPDSLGFDPPEMVPTLSVDLPRTGSVFSARIGATSRRRESIAVVIL